MGNDGLKIKSNDCPLGKFVFCAITGKGIENENNSKYYYKSTLEVDEDKAADFLDMVEDFMEEVEPKGSECTKTVFQTHEDYEGIPEGKVWIYAHTVTTYEKNGEEFDKDINIYDTDGNKCKLPEGIGIGKGSAGKQMGSISVWTAGTRKKPEHGFTFWLDGIQIRDLIEYQFEEEVEADIGGSFKGFDKPQLEKDEGEEEKPARKPRRNRTKDEGEEEKPARKPRRNNRGER